MRNVGSQQLCAGLTMGPSHTGARQPSAQLQTRGPNSGALLEALRLEGVSSSKRCPVWGKGLRNIGDSSRSTLFGIFQWWVTQKIGSGQCVGS